MTSAFGVSWGASWGNAWGSIQGPSANGGGGDADAQRVREHWDYIESLRESQPKVLSVQVADDIRGVRSIEIPVDMPLPDGLYPRAMRGRVPVLDARPRVADVLDDPLILAALALLIDEADD